MTTRIVTDEEISVLRPRLYVSVDGFVFHR